MDIVGQEELTRAFFGDPGLQQRALSFATQSPENNVFISDVAKYILNLSRSVATNGAANEQGNSKKRKLEGESNGMQVGEIKPRFEVKDVSFSIPQRKKLHLELSKEIIQLRNPGTGQIEATESVRKFAYAVRLPVPEKTQKQYNYCLIPEYGEGIGRRNPKPDATGDSMVWTVNHGSPKNARALDDEWSQKLASSGDAVLDDALNIALSTADIKLTQPDPDEFASAIPEAHRKGEKAYHVKAFRGSKDGYLFLLSTGIFFGFKKPLLFFPFDYIQSISYTSVLQRTFNLVITVTLAPDNNAEDLPDTEEFEFSMIDQADFAGIDAYVKRHELSDASMAAGRRAKKLNINKPKKGGAADPSAAATGAENGEDDDGEEEESELKKAQEELEQQEQDSEDEEEEDYDPGSDGESEGSGSSSDEDEPTQGRKSKDLVADELGSEAEDVSVDDEDEDEDMDEEGDDEHGGQELDEEDAVDEEDELASPQQHRPLATGVVKSHVPVQLEEQPDPYDEDQL